MRKTHIRSPAARSTALAVAMLAGCRGDPPAPAVRVGPTVQLTVDDGAPRTIEVSGPVALSKLVEVAPTAWIDVRADASDDRGIELGAPATRYAGSEVRVYLDQGQPALGVFPPITPDMPPEVAALARQPTASLTNLASVHILTRPIVLSGLVVVAGGLEVPISAAQVHALPTVPRGTSRAQGWLLASLITLASPDREVKTVQLVGAGDPVTLDAQMLRDPEQIVVLKQNQRGEYVFRVWARDGRHPTRELRRVTRIVVE